jgi:2-amino-4-hydroxy-6-hydroxymethyldihydropteridine diphosphokinase
MITSYCALGSNLDHPQQQLQQALHLIAHSPSLALQQCSPFYSNPPLGPTDQPDFINAVARIDTTLDANDLLTTLQQIEYTMGRRRDGERWGARVIDLDILLYADHIIDTQQLTIPHYDLNNRAFMLKPLADIAPNLILPCGTALQTLLKQHDCSSLIQINHTPLGVTA